MPTPAATRSLHEILHQTFGHQHFRPHQQQVCEAAASGRDVLLVMPTGAGKSLCYQLPALALGGTCLVISPLIALMDDQASKLASLGLRVARIHSGLSRDEARQTCREYLAGSLDFLLIAPERMRVPGFPEMLAKRPPTLVAIDEAHCISQWGHDFRPDYRTLGQYLPMLRPARVMALTATATPAVRDDILNQLQLADAAVFVTGFRRENLAVEVVELSKPERHPFIAKLLKPDAARPAIVYAPSRKAAEELAAELNRKFPTAAYHAGLLPTLREQVQTNFLQGKLDVVVATIAFGMGIDKADIRTVVHAALPASVEGFYQEIGRAGRDGLPSRSVLLHGFADRKLQEFFLEKNYPPTSDLERVARALPEDFVSIDPLQQKLKLDRETLDRAIEKLLAAGVAVMNMAGEVRATGETAWQKKYESQVAVRRAQIDRMIAFAESTTCRMVALVRHFGDTTDRAGNCGKCDICAPGEATGSVSRPPDASERRALRAILAATEGNGRSTGKLFTDLALTKDRREFDGWVEALSRAGLLSLSSDTFRTPDGRDVTYRKAAATSEGRDPDDRAMDTVLLRGDASGGPTPKMAKRSREKSAPAVELNAAQKALEGELRAWRKSVAAESGKPAFIVMGDAVLTATAAAQPRTLGELECVRGMGPQKVEQFGAAIVALVRGQGDAPPRSALERPSLPLRAAATSPPAPRSAEKPARPASPKPVIVRAAARRVEAAPAELTEAQRQLDAALRDWRSREAAAAGLPSFFVLSDTALRSIVAARPGTLQELGALANVGAEKVERFGAAIVRICG